MSTLEYRIVSADMFARQIKVGAVLSLAASLHRGAVGFQPMSLHLHPISTAPESDDIPDWDTWETHAALYRPVRGVALFFPNGSGATLADGEVWTVRITALRQGGDDVRGNKKVICNVEVVRREEKETEPVYEAATNMWVSELRSGRRVIETYEIDARVDRVRYMERAHSDYSYEYDEYLMQLEGGDWEVVKRVRIPLSMRNERMSAESLQRSLGKLARSLPSMTQRKTYPILPEDGKTQ